MLINERTFSATAYRFGYGGKEMDNDVSGTGNQYDYGFRIYNPRIGRFLSVDAMAAFVAWLTPFQFAGNMPIAAVDVDGLEVAMVTKKVSTDGQRTIIRVRFIHPDNRVEHPVYGKTGVNYQRVNGTIARFGQYLPFSTEAIVMQSYMVDYYVYDPNGTEVSDYGLTYTKKRGPIVDAFGEHAALPQKVVNNGQERTLYQRWASVGMTEYKAYDIFFNNNKSGLTSGELNGRKNSASSVRRELDKIVTQLNNNPSMIVMIESYTDKDASPEYNKELSEKRTKAVVDYLTSKGISADRIVQRNNGEAEADQTAKKDEDRKVSVKIVDVQSNH
jgi:RHS repeat-associated protein